jgi:hypothetical protein
VELRWQLRERGETAAASKVELAEVRQLVQVADARQGPHVADLEDLEGLREQGAVEFEQVVVVEAELHEVVRQGAVDHLGEMVLQAVQVEVAAGLVVRVIPFVPLLVVDGGGEEAVEDVRSKRGTGRGGSRCLAFASREVSAQVVVRVVERNGGGVLGANRSLDGGSTQVRRRPRRAVSASPGGHRPSVLIRTNPFW